MDWAFKASVTGCSVALVMWLAQRWCRCLAGIVSGLPIITAPALMWVAQQQGPVFAAQAAVASVAAGAMLVALVVGFVRVAHRRGAAWGLAAGIAAAALLVLPTEAVSASLGASLLIGTVSCLLGLLAVPAAAVVLPRAVPRDRRVELATCSALAGSVTAATTLVGPWLGSFAAGLLASLPMVSASVAIAEYARGGPAAATQFLRGVVGGLFGRSLFCAAFALAVEPVGVWAAFALSCAAALLASCAIARAMAWQDGAGRRRAERLQLSMPGHATP